MDTIEKLKKALSPTLSTIELREKSEDLYWLYRTAKDNPKELEVAFLLESNRLQKKVIDELVQMMPWEYHDKGGK